MTQPVIIKLELMPERAEALAQFIKRLILDACTAKCSRAERNTGTHYTMQSALFDVSAALAAAGYEPR